MKEDYIRWHTPHLSRDFEMLVFGHGGYPVIAFPTSLGRYYQNKDFGLIQSVAHLVNAGRVKIFCPDSIDAQSWYNKAIHPADRVRTHIAYENVIRHDVVPHALRDTGRGKVCVAGASFGGYHAANFAFRHPDKVGAMISLSGAFDIKQFLDGYYDDACYFNNPPDYLQNLNDDGTLGHLRQMGIILGTGEWDSCRNENHRLSAILNAKGIAHWLDDRKWCGHDWNWWREMFPAYLERLHY
jgi:esterase/lipase superfamily enzyme